jgi:hypothetical protein
LVRANAISYSGRCGRNGRLGVAFNFVSREPFLGSIYRQPCLIDEKYSLQNILDFIGNNEPMKKLLETLPIEFIHYAEELSTDLQYSDKKSSVSDEIVSPGLSSEAVKEVLFERKIPRIEEILESYDRKKEEKVDSEVIKILGDTHHHFNTIDDIFVTQREKYLKAKEKIRAERKEKAIKKKLEMRREELADTKRFMNLNYKSREFQHLMGLDPDFRRKFKMYRQKGMIVVKNDGTIVQETTPLYEDEDDVAKKERKREKRTRKPKFSMNEEESRFFKE